LGISAILIPRKRGGEVDVFQLANLHFQFARREIVEDDQTTATGRIVALDRARTFITLLVIVHHSVVNYTYFGNGDRMRWLGFDLVVLFNSEGSASPPVRPI
jgi:hypothetical protein